MLGHIPHFSVSFLLVLLVSFPVFNVLGIRLHSPPHSYSIREDGWSMPGSSNPVSYTAWFVVTHVISIAVSSTLINKVYNYFIFKNVSCISELNQIKSSQN